MAIVSSLKDEIIYLISASNDPMMFLHVSHVLATGKAALLIDYQASGFTLALIIVWLLGFSNEFGKF
jgi:hypothetical protein